MAWTYHDYEEQTSDALRLARLRQHISEVSQKIQANYSAGGDARANDPLERYLHNTVHPRRRELERTVAAVSAGFTRGRVR